MFVAGTSACFADLPLDAAIEHLCDLEFTNIEIAIHESGNQLKPSVVHTNFDKALEICRQTRRLTPIAYSVEIEASDDAYFQQFASICKLAKATKVVTIVVPSAELGTPFNGEVERLLKLVAIASLEGAVVAVKIQSGRVTQDLNTVVVLCENVKGLGVTLDPSHLIYGPHQGGNYNQILKYVCHVHLRDTAQDQLQVRVGQGEVEYGKLVSQLEKIHYNRALTVDITSMEGVDHSAELRKLRLLLESLL